MTFFGIGAGLFISFYGLLTIILQRSYLFGGNLKRYTEKSVKLFALFSGLAEIIAGSAIAFYNISIFMDISFLVRWCLLAVIWIAVAVIISLYIIVLVKKK